MYPIIMIVVNGKAEPGGNGTAVKPFRTLEEAVRAVRLQPGNGAVEIVLEPGTYVQKHTIKLNKGKSGAPGSELVIRSRSKHQPAVLTGGTTLLRWTPVKDAALLARLPQAARAHVRACNLADHGVNKMDKLVFGGFGSKRCEPKGSHRFATLPVPELFYKGEPQTMAEWPNGTMTRIPVNEVPEKEVERFRRWGKETHLWLHGYWWRDWADAYEKVQSVLDNGMIRLQPPTSGLFLIRSRVIRGRSICGPTHCTAETSFAGMTSVASSPTAGIMARRQCVTTTSSVAL